MIVGGIEKQPSETFIIGIDFKFWLGVGETIQSAEVTAKNAATGANTTGTMLSGSPTISGSQVTHRLAAAGTPEDRHIVQFKITTSATNIYEDELAVSVKEY